MLPPAQLPPMSLLLPPPLLPQPLLPIPMLPPPMLLPPCCRRHCCHPVSAALLPPPCCRRPVAVDPFVTSASSALTGPALTRAGPRWAHELPAHMLTVRRSGPVLMARRGRGRYLGGRGRCRGRFRGGHLECTQISVVYHHWLGGSSTVRVMYRRIVATLGLSVESITSADTGVRGARAEPQTR